MNSPVKGSLEGNKISSVSAYDNTITRSEGSNANRTLPGIIAADIIEPWPRIEAGTKLDNNSCGQPDIHDNIISGYFRDVFDMSQLESSFLAGTSKTAEEILRDFKESTESVFGENSMDWYWYGDTFSSSSAGSFTAAGRRIGQIGFDYLYECVNVTANAELSITSRPNDESYGTVSGGGTYDKGESVTLTAAPKEGYRFVHWTEDGSEVSTDAIYTFTAECSRTLTAEFAAIGTPAITTPIAFGYDRSTVTWSTAEGASGYELWYSTSGKGKYTKLVSQSGTSYTHTGLKAGTVYYYKVRAFCIAGSITTYGSYSGYVSVKPLPAAPASASAERSGYNSIKVTWSAVPGTTGYMVYRAASADGTFTKVATTSRTSAVISGLNTGTTYYFRVRAYRSSTSIYGDYSPVASASARLNEMTGVKAATYYPTSIKISWDAVPGRSGYEIWRSLTGEEGSFTKYTKTTSTYYKNTGLTIDQKYYYQVRAYRIVNKQTVYNGYSAVVSDTARVFQVTGVKAAMYSVKSNKISWSTVTGASGYVVYRCDAEGNILLGLTPTSKTYFYDKTITAGETYYYKVRAYRTAGSEKKYGEYSGPVTCPSKAAGIKAAMYTVNSNKISWNCVADRTGYEVWRAETADGEYTMLTQVSKPYTSAYFYDKNIDKNKTYYYKVRAYQTIGAGKVYCGFSDIVPVVNKVTGASAVSYSYSSVKISWSAVASRTAYELYLCDSEGNVGVSPLQTTVKTYYTHTGLTTDQTYYYKVRAYQTIGGVKVYSNFSDVIPVKPVIKAVTVAKAAKYSSTKIKLTWSLVSGATGYEIERCTTGIEGDYGNVKTTTGTAVSYYDSGLTAGTKYYYRIRAYRTAGGKTYYGGWSGVVSAKL